MLVLVHCVAYDIMMVFRYDLYSLCASLCVQHCLFLLLLLWFIPLYVDFKRHGARVFFLPQAWALGRSILPPSPQPPGLYHTGSLEFNQGRPVTPNLYRWRIVQQGET
jgi:hypothetical protein